MIRLSELQLEVMQVVWDRGEVTVGDVHEALAGRDLAYTTVATLLKRLEDRGALAASREGRQLVYRATVEEAEVRRSMVGSLVDRLFQGDPAALVSQLIGDDRVGPEEAARIRRLLSDLDEEGSS